MTALKEYDRLECTGLWRSEPADQRREVAVSFGEATLVLTDMQNRALAHWSLAAIDLQKYTSDTAILRPGSDSAESLEISDRVMLEALAKVHKAIARNRPHPGRLRLILALVHSKTSSGSSSLFLNLSPIRPFLIGLSVIKPLLSFPPFSRAYWKAVCISLK